MRGDRGRERRITKGGDLRLILAAAFFLALTWMHSAGVGPQHDARAAELR